MDDFYCVVTFHVTQQALIFERFMKDKNIDVKLMPAPRQVSTSCGTSARIPCEFEEDIKLWVKEFNLPIDEFHRIENKTNNNWFAKYINK